MKSGQRVCRAAGSGLGERSAGDGSSSYTVCREGSSSASGEYTMLVNEGLGDRGLWCRLRISRLMLQRDGGGASGCRV